VEKNNVLASEETCELFDDYLSMLTAWSRQSRPKPFDDDDDDYDYYDDDDDDVTQYDDDYDFYDDDDDDNDDDDDYDVVLGED
jgi:hypothetical protein